MTDKPSLEATPATSGGGDRIDPMQEAKSLLRFCLDHADDCLADHLKAQGRIVEFLTRPSVVALSPSPETDEAAFEAWWKSSNPPDDGDFIKDAFLAGRRSRPIPDEENDR